MCYDCLLFWYYFSRDFGFVKLNLPEEAAKRAVVEKVTLHEWVSI